MGSGAGPTQCYAAHHRNCVGKISKEHFLSDSVLREFGTSVKVSGFYWITKGDSKSLTSATIGSNILCQGHNSALSPLDDEAHKLFRIALDFAEAGRRNASENEFRLFAGEDIERYVLKAMIGAVSSASLAAGGQQIRVNRASDGHKVLVDLLFGWQTIPEGMGLYVLATSQQRQTVRKHIETYLLMDANDRKAIVGIYMNIFGLPLAFLFRAPSGPTLPFDDAIYRPGSVAFHEPNGAVRHIQLSWEGQGDRDGVIFGMPAEIKMTE